MLIVTHFASTSHKWCSVLSIKPKWLTTAVQLLCKSICEENIPGLSYLKIRGVLVQITHGSVFIMGLGSWFRDGSVCAMFRGKIITVK